VDLDGAAADAREWVASVETTCSNHDLAGKLPFGGGHPSLKLVGENTRVGALGCLTAQPNPCAAKPPGRRLAADLAPDPQSPLARDQTSGPEALREILHL